MKKQQKIVIICLLGIPLLLGVALLVFGSFSPLNTMATKKIGLVRINDIILISEPYVEQLRSYRENDAIAGVLLRIDSPGGAVAPSQEIFSEAMKYREIKKPLVVTFGNVAASGGYYIASPALKIFSNPGSITASIGVILRFPQYFKLMDKLGITMQVLKSGESKDMGSPQREMTLLEKKLFHDILSDIHTQFIEDVGRARSMNMDSLRSIADGRIMTGKQALAARLVDTLGSFEEATDYIKKYCGLPQNAAVVEKKRHESFLRTLIFGELAERFPSLTTTFFPAGSYFLYEK
jgi:protease-4